jgi:hypothetical protein
MVVRRVWVLASAPNRGLRASFLEEQFLTRWPRNVSTRKKKLPAQERVGSREGAHCRGFQGT